MIQRILDRLAHRLAADNAATLFVSECHPQGDGWFAIPPVKERDGLLNDAIRYLRAMKMLEGKRAGAKVWRLREGA